MIYEAPPIPNGYKICDECGISVHSMQYPTCYHCLSKKNPEKHPEKNFRASTDHEVNASLSKGGGGGDRQDMNPDSDKQVPAPTDPGCYCICHEDDHHHCSICYPLHKEDHD